jgi:hypothetical protein
MHRLESNSYGYDGQNTLKTLQTQLPHEKNPRFPRLLDPDSDPFVLTFFEIECEFGTDLLKFEI